GIKKPAFCCRQAQKTATYRAVARKIKTSAARNVGQIAIWSSQSRSNDSIPFIFATARCLTAQANASPKNSSQAAKHMTTIVHSYFMDIPFGYSAFLL
ncbi:MAG: hypothetical protein KGI66_03295, partial [Patescibacteria group bacterium]|nr:hypothetical protein [Patescibacteria group bacterium]